jgi:hypothetical protein
VVGSPGVALAESWPAAAVTVTSAGQEIVGAPAVTTVTSKLQLPPPVAEVTTTVVVPTGKKDPDGVVAVMSPQVPTPSAVEKVTNAPGLPLCVAFASVVMLLGQSNAQVAAAVPATTVFSAFETLSSSCSRFALDRRPAEDYGIGRHAGIELINKRERSRGPAR